jgi:hypothetical protein
MDVTQKKVVRTFLSALNSAVVSSSHPVRKKQLIDFKATRGLPSNPNHRKDTDLTGADSGVFGAILTDRKWVDVFCGKLPFPVENPAF